MKSISFCVQKFWLLIALVTIGIYSQSCNKEQTLQPISEQDQTKALLTSGTWKLQSESVDGVDQTALYSKFTINFTSSNFTAVNGGAIWPIHGSWNFDGTDSKTIRRNDGTIVKISVTSATLVMTINWTTSTLGSGKANSTSGQNVFSMVK